jgi:hypothetical protein
MAADIELLIANLGDLEQAIDTAFPGIMCAITIITEGRDLPYLRIDFGADYVYMFGLLNRVVDWRCLDARNWSQQELIIDLVTAWAKDVFNDGRRRRACKQFVDTIEEELVAYIFSPERICFEVLLNASHTKN